jgi:putative DNA primase/helicase
VGENAARLAATFHVLEHGPTSDIDSKTLFRAAQLILWYLGEARRVLAAFDRSQSLGDAGVLLEWLHRQPVTDPPTPINPRRILQFAPRALRDVKRRDAAIKVLVDHNHLLVAPPTALGRGAKCYLLNPRSEAAP